MPGFLALNVLHFGLALDLALHLSWPLAWIDLAFGFAWLLAVLGLWLGLACGFDFCLAFILAWYRLSFCLACLFTKFCFVLAWLWFWFGLDLDLAWLGLLLGLVCFSLLCFWNSLAFGFAFGLDCFGLD